MRILHYIAIAIAIFFVSTLSISVQLFLFFLATHSDNIIKELYQLYVPIGISIIGSIYIAVVTLKDLFIRIRNEYK